MKAQAGGAVPVVFSTGALRETVRFGYRTLRSFTDDAERRLPRGTLQAWLAALVDYQRHPDKQEAVRQVMMPRCQRDFAWSGVARQWLDEFSR
jgi:hypothetical protein